MKSVSLFLTTIIVFTMCSSPSSSGGESDQVASEPVVEEVIEEKPAVCIWDKISVREQPNSKSRWVTSISVGETLTFLGKTAIDSADKDREYLNIRLADGTEGWSSSDFIVIDGVVAVLQSDKDIYNRPDLLTKSDKSFTALDIIAISAEQDDWLEVVGKREDGKWIQKGWIKNGDLSKESLDIAVAKFTAEALQKESAEEQEAALNEILENADFGSSYFIPFVEEKVAELQPQEVEVSEEETEMDSTAVE